METILRQPMSDGVEKVPNSRRVFVGVEKSSDILRYEVTFVQYSSQVQTEALTLNMIL